MGSTTVVPVLHGRIQSAHVASAASVQHAAFISAVLELCTVLSRFFKSKKDFAPPSRQPPPTNCAMSQAASYFVHTSPASSQHLLSKLLCVKLNPLLAGADAVCVAVGFFPTLHRIRFQSAHVAADRGVQHAAAI